LRGLQGRSDPVQRHAHVTLDYGKHEYITPRAVGPIACTVTEFCLVDSHYGHGRHEVLQRWPLRGRQGRFDGW
jgi:2'-5' RNA ligase